METSDNLFYRNFGAHLWISHHHYEQTGMGQYYRKDNLFLHVCNWNCRHPT